MGTCAELAVLVPGVSGCRDDRAALLGRTTAAPGTELVLRAERPGERALRYRVQVPAEQLTRPEPDPADPAYGGVSYGMFLPIGHPALRDAGQPPVATWQVVLDGGGAARESLLVAAARLGPGVRVMLQDRTYLEQVGALRATLWSASATALLVGFAALLIGGVDRALERRRQLAALHVLGVPPRVVRRSQLIQALAPLAVGVPLAGSAGLLAGAAYLNFGGERAHTPWQPVLLTAAAGAGGAVLVAAGTVPALGRVSPGTLRRE